MEWYIPITILPGIGMIILSTSNILISLNDEISNMSNEKEKYTSIINQKIKQLKKLNYALIAQYISAFLLTIGGVIGEINQQKETMVYWVISGIIVLGLSFILLINYAIKSLKIRQEHLKI
jgi:steroid 5-alpha reductase family enzyme